MKCVKCQAEADFDAPEPLCDQHWARWWVETQPDDVVVLTREETEKWYQDVMKILRPEI
jgi:hypothetical protein